MWTPLIAAQQTSAVDLPQKYLVWQDAEGVDGTATTAAPGFYLVEMSSDTTVAGAIARYTAAFTAKVLKPVATVDHAADAASGGLTLRPTETTFVGDPEVGTALLQQQQTMGTDLPVRYLAWQDQAGTVHEGHPDIRVLAARHHITGLTMIDTATTGFTATAAGTTP